jgi:hypothetical protein
MFYTLGADATPMPRKGQDQAPAAILQILYGTVIT